MSQDNEPLSIACKIEKLPRHIFASGVFVAIGIWMICSGESSGYFVLLFFGLCFVALAITFLRQRRDPVALIVSEKELQFVSQLEPAIPWENIRSCELIFLPQYSYFLLKAYAARPTVTERLWFLLSRQRPDFSCRPSENRDVMIMTNALDFDTSSLEKILNDRIAHHKKAPGILDRHSETRALQDSEGIDTEFASWNEQMDSSSRIFPVGIFYGVTLVVVYHWR